MVIFIIFPLIFSIIFPQIYSIIILFNLFINLILLQLNDFGLINSPKLFYGYFYHFSTNFFNYFSTNLFNYYFIQFIYQLNFITINSIIILFNLLNNLILWLFLLFFHKFIQLLFNSIYLST